MLLHRWEPLMVSHHPAKSGGHRNCGSGDLIFLMVEEKDIASLLNSTNITFDKPQGMPSSHIQDFTAKIALTKAFANVCNKNSPILVTLNLQINLNIQLVTF